jgi:5-methylcytosine-specific restriction endonuclease McrA
MSRSRIPKALRAKVAARARYRCAYCLTAESIVGTSMELDHLIPEALGGLAPTQRLTVIRPPYRHAMEAEGATDVSLVPESG